VWGRQVSASCRAVLPSQQHVEVSWIRRGRATGRRQTRWSGDNQHKRGDQVWSGFCADWFGPAVCGMSCHPVLDWTLCGWAAKPAGSQSSRARQNTKIKTQTMNRIGVLFIFEDVWHRFGGVCRQIFLIFIDLTSCRRTAISAQKSNFDPQTQ
jgi:hypothetical protein